jgi:hypothetical protein
MQVLPARQTRDQQGIVDAVTAMLQTMAQRQQQQRGNQLAQLLTGATPETAPGLLQNFQQQNQPKGIGGFLQTLNPYSPAGGVSDLERSVATSQIQQNMDPLAQIKQKYMLAQTAAQNANADWIQGGGRNVAKKPSWWDLPETTNQERQDFIDSQSTTKNANLQAGTEGRRATTENVQQDTILDALREERANTRDAATIRNLDSMIKNRVDMLGKNAEPTAAQAAATMDKLTMQLYANRNDGVVIDPNLETELQTDLKNVRAYSRKKFAPSQAGGQPAGQRTPPAEYPDAVWDEQKQMFTVIRNGRLLGIK